MAKSLPKASPGAAPVGQETSATKTPVGVWVIVGLAVFFVIGGLGISAFLVWKSVGFKRSVLAVKDAAGEKVSSVPKSRGLADPEVGVEHPSPNPTIDDAG